MVRVMCEQGVAARRGGQRPFVASVDEKAEALLCEMSVCGMRVYDKTIQ